MCRTLTSVLQQMNNTKSPVAVAPTPDVPLPGSLVDPFSGPTLSQLPLPSFPQVEIQEEIAEEEERGYFLFQLAQKYDMPWAIKGDAPFAQSELGRPSAVRTVDKMFLTPGAGIDIITHVNNHLRVPALDAIPENFKSLVEDAPRRIKPLSFSDFKPIPMARYSSDVSGMAAFLDSNMTGPIASFLPKPTFPPALINSRFMVLSALEGITALNVLNELPESTTKEDRDSLSDHLGGIFYAILRRASENLGTGIRSVRANQLGGVTKATRDELVNQPILAEMLYTDDKKVGLASQPPSKRAKFFPRQGTRGGWNPPAALGSPPGGFQPQGGHSTQSFAQSGRRPRPPHSRQSYRGGRGGRRGRR